MKDIFVLYANKEKNLAKKYVSKIEEQGYSCWVSPRDLSSAVDDTEAIKKHIDNAKLVILLLSTDANKNTQVKDLFNYAEELEKPIIPIKIDKVSDDLSTQSFFNYYDWVDAHEDSFDESLEILYEFIEEMASDNFQLKKKASTTTTTSKNSKYILIGAIVAIAILFVGYYVLNRPTAEQENQLLGQWQLTDYQDNLIRAGQDSIDFIAQKEMMKQMVLVINDDASYSRSMGQQFENGTWRTETNGTVFITTPVGGDGQENRMSIVSLGETQVVFQINETDAETGNKIVTSLIFSKF